jgi:hypothetical protein
VSVTTTPLSSPLGNAIVIDTDADGTSENNVRGGASTVYVVEVDNSLNAATSYLKFYDNAAPTVGTTAPTLVIPATLGETERWTNLAGYAFATALSFACVTDGGGTAGTTSPASNVTVRILCT